MAEYIEREAAIKAVYESDPFGVHKYFGWRAMDIEKALLAATAADVAPVRHGKWDVMPNTKIRRICSCCGWDVPEFGKFYSYCPNCGAEMYGAE